MKQDSRIKPRWTDATLELIDKLEIRGVRFNEFSALEMFGRGGDWHTKNFANRIKNLEVWEIDPKWENQLRENLPNAKIRIIDSIKEIRDKDLLPKYDLILIDNPMNTYGPTSTETNAGKYCEHFDVMPQLGKLIDKEAIVIFNVNRKPFDYQNHSNWKGRRENFYGFSKTDDIPLEYLLNFYKKYFAKLGFKTEFYDYVIRVFFDDIDMTYYFAFKLKRLEK